jgi:hypothetical protein
MLNKKRLHVFSGRVLSRFRPLARVSVASGLLLPACNGSWTTLQAAASKSIARAWDEQALSTIRIDTPNPPVQARNLFSLSVCMYDAWAAYDTNGAVRFVYHQKHTAVRFWTLTSGNG